MKGAVWAADLKELLMEMKHANNEAREQGKHELDVLEVIDWEARFLELLNEGDRLNWLRKHQQTVLLFLEDLRVDFDNNLVLPYTLI